MQVMVSDPPLQLVGGRKRQEFFDNFTKKQGYSCAKPLDKPDVLGYNAPQSVEVRNASVAGEMRGNAPAKGLPAEIHLRFPPKMGWSVAEHVPDCHFMWRATAGVLDLYCRGVSPRQFFYIGKERET